MSPDPRPARAKPFSAAHGMEALRRRLCHELAGVSCSQIAACTGVNRETIRRYLKGGAPPSVQFIVAVADWRGLSLEWLLRGESPRLRPGTARQPSHHGGTEHGLTDAGSSADSDHTIVVPRAARAHSGTRPRSPELEFC